MKNLRISKAFVLLLSLCMLMSITFKLDIHANDRHQVNNYDCGVTIEKLDVHTIYANLSDKQEILKKCEKEFGNIII